MQPKALFPHIYRILIPLPKSPLKALNSYLVTGHPRNLIIDTGFWHPVCHQAMTGALEALGVSMENTDIFLTHLHYDHGGNAVNLAAPSTRIYSSEVDKAAMEGFYKPGFDRRYARRLKGLGFSGSEVEELMRVKMRERYSGPPNTSVQSGATLAYGGYTLECIATPGHTPGHMCLYEARHQLLFCGDHILHNISPNITSWENRPDSLGDYLESLAKIQAMPLRTVLCGHRDNPKDPKKRIGELLAHHGERLEEAAQVLRKYGPLSGYEAAAYMAWQAAGGWQAMPTGQRYFAAGEAAAHLDRLVALGCAATSWQDGILRYL